MPENITTTDLQFALDGAVKRIITEMASRFGEVNQRLDRIDATLMHHGKRLASGARVIAGFNGWVGKGPRRLWARPGGVGGIETACGKAGTARGAAIDQSRGISEDSERSTLSRSRKVPGSNTVPTIQT